MQTIETEYARYEHQRHTRDQRQRAVGGGRRCDLPLVIRVTMLLLYLRAHIPQWLVALLFGAHQSDSSRDLRRLLPLLIDVLPAPVVWDIVDEPQPAQSPEPQPAQPAEPQPAQPAEPQPRDRITSMHILIDATEQEVARSQDRATRKQ